MSRSNKILRPLLKNVHFYFNTNQVGNKSFYRRLLPNHLISLNSHEGKKIFEQSLLEKNCEAFFGLVQQFITQNSPSTCASATMAMILNALKIDPGYNWKGIWRWFDDYNISHLTQTNIKEGLTLEDWNRLIQLNFAKSMAFSPLQNKDGPRSQALRQSSLALFRNSIIACNRRSNIFLTINFHRKSLGQTGIGHFSPIAGYNSKRDLALILDVAKFKYDSYWCSVEQIYDSLKPLDAESQQSRGFLINKKKYTDQKQPESPLCFLELDFITNRKLRNKLYFHQRDMPVFLLNLLNDQEIHALLIPVFYQFSTLEMENKDEVIRNLTPQKQLQRLTNEFNSLKLNSQAKTLLEAYSKQNQMSLVYFLSSIFSYKSQSFVLIPGKPSLNEQQMIKLIRKCQTYFQLDVKASNLNPNL